MLTTMTHAVCTSSIALLNWYVVDTRPPRQRSRRVEFTINEPRTRVQIIYDYMHDEVLLVLFCPYSVSYAWESKVTRFICDLGNFEFLRRREGKKEYGYGVFMFYPECNWPNFYIYSIQGEIYPWVGKYERRNAYVFVFLYSKEVEEFNSLFWFSN